MKNIKEININQLGNILKKHFKGEEDGSCMITYCVVGGINDQSHPKEIALGVGAVLTITCEVT